MLNLKIIIGSTRPGRAADHVVPNRGAASLWISRCHLSLLPLVPQGQSPASPLEALR